MFNAKRVIIGSAGLLVCLILGVFLSLVGGSIDETDKSDREQVPGEVAVSSGNKGGTVYSGIVRDFDGNAIEGAKLHILGPCMPKTVSSREGRYEISLDISKVHESHRDIWIIARHEEKNLAAATRVGPKTRTQNITLLPAVTATGRVTDSDGKAIRDGEVSFGFTAAKGYISSFADHKRFAADSRGVCKVPYIPAKNRYLVRFYAEGYGTKELSVNTDDAVDGVLELGSVVLFRADQKISGVVVGADGKGVGNVQVFRQSSGQPVGCEKTDADGQFSLEVCEGEVVLSAIVRKEDGKQYVGRARVASGAKDVRIVLEPREKR